MKLNLMGRLVSIIVAVFAVLMPIGLGPLSLPSDNPTIALAPPGLTGSAFGQSGGAGEVVAALLDSEAGISAYFLSPSAISLNAVRSLYRTIEAETSSYIIGSVPIQDYPETEDIHVYMNVDGWVLAYYLKTDPTAKIVDWKAFTGSGALRTKLETTLLVVASTLGVPSPAIGFYHFQYPNANNLMLIADYSESNESLQVNLTGTYGYFERSWGLGGDGYSCVVINHAELSLNGTQIGTMTTNGWSNAQGFIAAGQMLPDTVHTISINRSCLNSAVRGGLALVYRVP